MIKNMFIAVVCLIVLPFSYSYAGNMADASAAYDKGDYKTVLKLLLIEAKKGNDLAQYNLGNMYLKGQGILRNDKKAAQWFRLAAKQGHALAQNNLGNMYRKGQGVLQNYREAVKWFSLAAKQGVAMAECNLGIMYADGLGIEKNMTTAKRLVKEGIDAGEESCRKVWEKYNLADY